LESAGFLLGFAYMKAKASQRSQRAVTLVEVLFVIGTVATLLLVVLPALQNSRRRPSRINCVNNIKQVSLGLRMWANDNEDKFPMQVFTNSGSSLKRISNKEVYRYFIVASNEIASPKVLRCPEDLERNPVATFPELSNKSLSYFLNLSALENEPSGVLIGDRHLTRNGTQYANGSYLISTQQVLTWGKESHKFGGNIGLSDGSVQQTTDQTLQSVILNAKSPTNWLAFP
jgi:competence protein ComGC